MRCDILTLFPDMVAPVLGQSILKRAQEKGLLQVQVRNLRDYTLDRHRVADDVPYGGGGGMVMKPEPIYLAVEAVLGHPVGSQADLEAPVILLTPQGRVFNQAVAQELAQLPRIVLICGRYEGFDERVRRHLAQAAPNPSAHSA